MRVELGLRKLAPNMQARFVTDPDYQHLELLLHFSIISLTMRIGFNKVRSCFRSTNQR